MDPSAIALQGLEAASLQLDTAASRIASAGAVSPDGSDLDAVSLSEEMVALMPANTQYQANLATLKTSDQVEQNLVNVIA